MWSKAKQKLVRSLASKKGREREGLFLAEGPKVVGELLGNFPCRFIAGTTDYWQSHVAPDADEVVDISFAELEQASLQRAPQEVLAVFELPDTDGDQSFPTDGLTLALDGVQDPGNVGTILRIADWFGIETVYCSPDTADVFSPKVVQASMGALARVRARYVSLPSFLRGLPEETPVYGTFLDGDALYHASLAQSGVLVMGNEGNGISADVAECVTQRLYIPSYPVGRSTSESLNVATATAICCAEFRRRVLN